MFGLHLINTQLLETVSATNRQLKDARVQKVTVARSSCAKSKLHLLFLKSFFFFLERLIYKKRRRDKYSIL